MEYKIIEEIGLLTGDKTFYIKALKKTNVFSRELVWKQAYEKKRLSERSRTKVSMPVKFYDFDQALHWINSKVESKKETEVFSTQNSNIKNETSFVAFAKWLQDNYSTNKVQGGTAPLPKGSWRLDFTNDIFSIEDIFTKWYKNWKY